MLSVLPMRHLLLALLCASTISAGAADFLPPADSAKTFHVTDPALTIKDNDWVRIGAGSDAEYRQVLAPKIAPATTSVTLRLPLQLSHGNNLVVEHYAEQFLLGLKIATNLDLSGAANLQDLEFSTACSCPSTPSARASATSARSRASCTSSHI